MKTMMMVMLAAAALAAGCNALNTAAEGVKDKNLAVGSDTWGGQLEGTLTGTAETAPFSINGWFGRRKMWYISVKDSKSTDGLAKVVQASNTPLSVTAGASGVGIIQPSASADSDRAE